jgi:ribosomal-protein-alanine N-acetyltransferase
MLESIRLHFRLPKEGDLDAIFALHSLPESDRYNTMGIPSSIDVTAKLLKQWLSFNKVGTPQSYVWVLESKENNEFIGLAALNLGKPKFQGAEVWYTIDPNFWSRGFATETLKRILTFGFEELNLHRIQAGCAVDNIASQRVLEKSGMLLEGRRRKILPLKTGWSDNFEYSILETDWFIE